MCEYHLPVQRYRKREGVKRHERERSNRRSWNREVRLFEAEESLPCSDNVGGGVIARGRCFTLWEQIVWIDVSVQMASPDAAHRQNIVE